MAHRFRPLLPGAALCLAGAAAHAQSLPVLDDFVTGPAAIMLKGAGQTGNLTQTAYQSGLHIIGQKRATTLFMSLPGNPFRQNASIQIRKATDTAPAALVFSEGFQSEARLDMQYGTSAGASPLHLDVTAYDRFRIHFAGINGIVNFNILAYTGSAFSQWGCNLPPTFQPTTVDLPFANAAVGGAVLSSLDSFDFIFQSQGQGIDFGVTQIEFVPAGAAAADVTCGKIGG